MKAILDTMAHVARYEQRTPEKWQRVWNLFSSGHAIIFLPTPLISEVYYRIQQKGGQIDAQTYLDVLKANHNVRILPEDACNRLLFDAAKMKQKHKKYNLSLVDSFILAVALKERAYIYTSDYGLQEAAKKEKCDVNFLPLKNLEKYLAGS